MPAERPPGAGSGSPRVKKKNRLPEWKTEPVMRQLGIALALVISNSPAVADRMTYTLEDVQRATTIGVWCADDIGDVEGSLTLEAPWKTLMGEMTWAPSVLSSRRIVQAARDIKNGPCLILLVRHDGFAPPGAWSTKQEVLDLTSDAGDLLFTDDNVKMIEDTIRLSKLIREEWPSLPPAERWRIADVVLIGTLSSPREWECPVIHWMESRSVCKGGSGYSDRPTVIIPDPAGSVGERLFFLARNPGSGPRYVILGSEPATTCVAPQP